MITANLLTKYVLAPIWARLLIFITFYFIIRELHFMDFDFSSTDCMLSNDNDQDKFNNSININKARLRAYLEKAEIKSDLKTSINDLKPKEFETKASFSFPSFSFFSDIFNSNKK